MAITTASRPRGRPRDSACDAAIIEAALELTAERGYEGAKLDAIAARAGVSKPTIYRRWPGGKDELIAHAVRQRRDEVAEMIDTGTLRGDLLEIVRQNVSGVQQNAHLAIGMAQRLRESPELANVFHTHVVTPERGRFQHIIGRAVERGELPSVPKSAALLADVVAGAAHYRLLVMGEPLDPGQLVDDLLMPALKGVSPTE
jgi:AcrR family transcriptional regulator